MKMSEMFPSNFLGKEDIQRPTTTTIRAVRLQEIKGEDGNETKTVIDFIGIDKSFICNKTNAFTLCEAYGPDSDNWINKPVEVYVDPTVAFGGRRVGGIRLRIPAHGSLPPQAQPVTWTFQQAVENCFNAGITKDDLIAHLKSKGNASYQGARDTATVQALIAAKKQPEQSFDAQVGDAQEVPF